MAPDHHTTALALVACSKMLQDGNEGVNNLGIGGEDGCDGGRVGDVPDCGRPFARCIGSCCGMQDGDEGVNDLG
eukprot:2308050-Ditylum_brightwellii.AAC.1